MIVYGKMTSLFHLLWSFAVIIVLCTATQRDTDWLEVVPHFRGLEKFYRQIRARNGKLYNWSEEPTSPFIKNLICWNLFSSGVFELANFEPIDMEMASTYFELKLFYTDILKRLYEEQTIVEYETELKDFAYSNQTNLVNLPLVGGTVPEYVFVCLARDQVTNKIVKYYVSEEYNVSRWAFTHVAGRFMFTFVDGRLIVSHYAEEPATVLTKSDHNLEYFYLRARGNKEIASTPDVDPLCKLSVTERIQVCASVLSADYFDDEFAHYQPDTQGVSQECSKWKVVLADKLSQYEEWMIECVISSEDDTSVYLSRGYSPNKVFVYAITDRFSTHAMSLEYMCINVRNFQN